MTDRFNVKMRIYYRAGLNSCVSLFEKHVPCVFRDMTYSPPTLITGAGHQRTMSIITGCNQWLSLAETLLKVALANGNRSLVARTSLCGWAISADLGEPTYTLVPCWMPKPMFKIEALI